MCDSSRYLLRRGRGILARFDKINCPVLLTGSEDDNVLGAEATGLIAEKLKGHEGFEMFIYEGYGHAAYDLAPDYKDRMQKFLMSE